jgi:hypothetical protein
MLLVIIGQRAILAGQVLPRPRHTLQCMCMCIRAHEVNANRRAQCDDKTGSCSKHLSDSPAKTA